ncbi:insulinase family protein [candidate division KSB1 bacterium]|nr:insulinase family protein [candidate division KSB1 bacterium]
MAVLESFDINNHVVKTTLENGIRVVTERMPFVRSVSVGAWVLVGSSNETPVNNGISHFLEHMLFKGTQTRTAMEIAQSLESLGGSINASTGKEISLYNAHVLDENIEIAVDVLADILQNSTLAKDDLDLEKHVILAEINHAKEDPEELLLDHFYQNLFYNHPLGYFIYGTPEIVTNLETLDLRDYLESEYTPSRMVIAAAGNIHHDRFVEMVSKAFKQDNNHPNVPVCKFDSPPKIDHSVFELESIHQGHICTGVRTFGYNDERKYALIMLDILLGGGMSSRLFQNIREKYGFAYNVYSFTDIMFQTGVFGVYMACAKDKIEKSIELINLEFNKLKSEPVKNSDLDMIKSQVKGNIILGLESSARRMRKAGESEIYSGRHNTIDTIIEKINNVKPVQLTELANELFQESNFCTTILTPGKK